MKFIRIGVVLTVLLTTLSLEAQNTIVSLLEENMEQLAINEDNRNWEDELQELSHIIENPIDINSITKQQLEQFPFLSDLQIENILAYIYIHGQMKTIYELQLIGEMDERAIELLLPFVCVKPTEEKENFPSLKTILRYGKHEMLTRFDFPLYTRKGYDGDYLGPSIYHSLRYSFRYADYLQVGITGEKDAGEPLFALHNGKGYDYYSFYFVIKDIRKIRTLALGNYRLNFGQGLVLSSGFNLGKSYSMATAEYRAGGIRKHGSTDEYNYFRGGAATIALLPSLELSAFYSHRSMDGVIKEGEVTSIYKTGLHRTQKEVDKRNTFALQMAGGNVTFEKNNLKVGITGIYYFFNRPYEPALQTYAKYNLRGNSFYNLSVDYKYRLGRLLWTGEAAKGKQGYALLNKLKYNLSSSYKLLLIHRYYAYDYWAMFGGSFGEGSMPQNENGCYLAAEATPLDSWRFFVSMDLFSFPWWKYRISKPSKGVDAMIQATYRPKYNLSMYLNYRYKRKERDVAATGGEVISPIYYHRLRYRLTYTPGSFTFRTTLDYNHFRQQNEGKYRFERQQGYQATQLCAYRFYGFPLSASLQGSYFNTGNYDSRVYISERGLLYTFYTPSYYGKGFRYSACLRYDFNKSFMLLVKFGQTIYQDRGKIGSGNDLIEGNKKTDLQMQFRIRL